MWKVKSKVEIRKCEFFGMETAADPVVFLTAVMLRDDKR